MTTPTAYRVSVDGTGVEFSCVEGDTILRAALRAGVALGYECNSGSCGSCRYELLDGEVTDRRPDAPGLSPRDRRKGRRLACQNEPRSDCRIKATVPESVTAHRPTRQVATLKEVHPLTHDMSEFVFETDQHASFAPGQYAMLRLPDGDVERAYSMSNVGNCHRTWKFVVKRVPGGAATSLLFDKVESGSTVELDGPFGHAYLREGNDRNIVLVGGGSGLGAMVSIILGVAALPDAGAWTANLFIGGRTEKDLHVPQAVELAARRLGRLRIHRAVSDDVPGATGDDGPHRGFLHDVVVDQLGDSLADATYYAAGPPVMTDALARALVLEGGLDADRLFYDRFL
ncbi:2Fe-2S iron-sulfur cluster-binding protein [Pseudonocardia endophytica]|uniref:Toluene monooxygenase electron transfer component n=1 Tax=Pseudonocardia endophytica TaxID=401976 RepID=A0A4R1HSL6_PSEEN|nr:2Fe-2S iron-sulfur cluster binding domain-containing protein [Pseudonocardia endophytica]TCK25637.1 toluene monooxygenase electron transfer component [Pseudonocardia endophytica]